MLLCKLNGNNSLLCKLQDSKFLSCNLHDRNLLVGRLVHGDVVEVGSNFRKSYLCGDLEIPLLVVFDWE